MNVVAHPLLTLAMCRRLLLALAACCTLSLLAASPLQAAETYDLVLANGRVMDPESSLDAIRNIGISGGRIAAISDEPLAGERVLDVRAGGRARFHRPPCPCPRRDHPRLPGA